jgi:pimeloyl-ACP methyl ester carboxylesterase
MTPSKSQAADKRQAARDRRRLRALPVSQFGEECYVATGGQRIRVNVRWGTGVPLVLCNGIGASLEVLDPLVEQLDPDTTVVRFDVPGAGGSPTSLAPYGFPRLFLQQLHAGSKMGYLHQLLAGSVWTSLFALPAVRQQTLIVAGTDDPIIPMVNAHIMNALLPHSRLHKHSGGHIDLVHNAVELVPVIETFLHELGDRP